MDAPRGPTGPQYVRCLDLGAGETEGVADRSDNLFIRPIRSCEVAAPPRAEMSVLSGPYPDDRGESGGASLCTTDVVIRFTRPVSVCVRVSRPVRSTEVAISVHSSVGSALAAALAHIHLIHEGVQS